MEMLAEYASRVGATSVVERVEHQETLNFESVRSEMRYLGTRRLNKFWLDQMNLLGFLNKPGALSPLE